MRRRMLLTTMTFAALALPAVAQSRAEYPTVAVPPGAAPAQMRAQILRVNAWWVRNHTFVPCGGCMVRPPQSQLLWTFYKNQGYYPNWVRAARDVLRRKIRGDIPGLRSGGTEILEASTRRQLPNGMRYQVIQSAYAAPDGQKPPWRDAMSSGLVLSLVILSLPEEPTPADLDAAKTTAREYLNSFAVHWTAGGLVDRGVGDGRWYLEYAYANGARSRVLNGFMQSLVSLDRFSRQADDLARFDAEWGTLRDRARDYVRRGVLELVRTLPKYDLGSGVSKYSLTRPGPAPAKYHTYHLQLLARLEIMDYLPPEQRAIITRYRTAWGGEPLRTTLALDPGPMIPG